MDEKGIKTLLDAWSLLESEVPLKIVGAGPLDAQVQAAASRDPSITWIGQQSPAAVASLVGEAAFLVFPSLWYEGLPRTIIEAFAKGTPVIGSKLGAMQDLISHDRNGLLFEPGQPDALAAVVREIWQDHDRLKRLRQSARSEFESHYSYQANYQCLMTIYQQALTAKLSQNARN